MLSTQWVGSSNERVDPSTYWMTSLDHWIERSTYWIALGKERVSPSTCIFPLSMSRIPRHARIRPGGPFPGESHAPGSTPGSRRCELGSRDSHGPREGGHPPGL